MAPKGAHPRSPDFLIIGAMKAGTTTLHADLGAHRSIFFTAVKEPNDLVRAEIKTPEGIRRYRQLFSAARPDQLCGEASTNYTQLPVHVGAPAAAAAIAGPGLRLIYLVRDPIERALSHHRHLFTIGRCSPDLIAALESHPAIVQSSRYDMQLLSWLEHFPREQVAVVRFESYISNRETTTAGLLSFLGATFDDGWRPGPAQNLSSELRRPSWLIDRIGDRSNVVRVFASRLPTSIRRTVRHLASRTVNINDIVVSTGAVARLRDELAGASQWIDRETGSHWESPLRTGG